MRESGDQCSSGLVRSLREERREDLLHLFALALRALRTSLPVLRKRLHPIKEVVAVATAIFVGRHVVLHF
jgi:hypothetical protein